MVARKNKGIAGLVATVCIVAALLVFVAFLLNTARENTAALDQQRANAAAKNAAAAGAHRANETAALAKPARWIDKEGGVAAIKLADAKRRVLEEISANPYAATKDAVPPPPPGTEGEVPAGEGAPPGSTPGAEPAPVPAPAPAHP